MMRLRICDVFSRVSALFSALPAISEVRRLIHSTINKIPATNYSFLPVFSGGVSVLSWYGGTGVDTYLCSTLESSWLPGNIHL